MEHADRARRLIELEDLLNSHWRGRPEAEWDRHVQEQNFVCIGTLRWVAWWRIAQKPQEALQRIEAFVEDWELVMLLHRADPKHMEELIHSACLAWIEAAGEAGQAKAHDFLLRVMTTMPPSDNKETHYNYACIFARCGDVTQLLTPLKTYLSLMGPDRRPEARSRVQNNPYFDDLRDDARFQALLSD